MTAQGAKGEHPFAKKNDKKDEKKDEKKSEGFDLFTALLEKRKSESMEADPGTPSAEPHLINPPGGDGLKSGVNSGQLKTPRHKIAGTAGNDLEDVLDDVQEDDNDVNLAGAAQAGEEDEVAGAFRSLASEITGYGKEESKDSEAQKPNFDPTK
jgi:ribosomal protein L12E/L44/L45/RPP1/RPP2